MAIDPLTIGMLAILAVLVFFMFRNNKKRQRDAAELQSKVQVGANVMTNFGLFGVVKAIDEEDNKVLLETSPGNILTVHRQTVTRVIDDEPIAEAADEDAADTALDADRPAVDLGEPQYGERRENAPDSAGDTGTVSKDKKVDE
jgi:preprotein translocase subunit YajC